MRTLTGYIPPAMSPKTPITMILSSPLWNGAFFTLGCKTHRYISGAMHAPNHDQGVASAFHGETRTMGEGTPALSKLATETYMHIDH